VSGGRRDHKSVEYEQLKIIYDDKRYEQKRKNKQVLFFNTYLIAVRKTMLTAQASYLCRA